MTDIVDVFDWCTVEMDYTGVGPGAFPVVQLFTLLILILLVGFSSIGVKV